MRVVRCLGTGAAACLVVALSAMILVAPGYAKPRAGTASGGAGLGSGGSGLIPPVSLSTREHLVVPGRTARIIHGVAYAPALAPIAVQRAIWAGNRIRLKPYYYGGGHASFTAAGYDCSGAVSFVLHAAGLLKTPFDSSDFMGWGLRGLGQWITVYTNSGHAFVEIAGIRFDTSSEGDPHPAPGTGPHWRQLLHDRSAFAARHLADF